jgi:hypothetical protein
MTWLVGALRPDRPRVLLFIALLVLVAAAVEQSRVFADVPGTTPSGPLAVLPLWALAVVLLAPLLLLATPLVERGIDPTGLDSWAGAAVVAAYLYALACAGAAAVIRLRGDDPPRGRTGA